MLRSKHGFTILELITTIGILGFLMVSITFVYSTCLKAYNAGQDRSKVRTQLAQAIELMTNELYKATSITTCNENTLTFTVDLGTNSQLAYTYEYYSSNDPNGGNPYGPGYQYLLDDKDTPSGLLGQYTLIRRLDSDGFGNGSIKVANLKKLLPGHPIFSCSNGLITIDVTALNYGETVRQQTKVRPRNMPTGLAGWWKFDETSGSMAVDSSGNGNNGDLTGHSPTMNVAGPTGTTPAFSFNGSGQYVNIPNSTQMNFTSAYTISLWAYTNWSSFTPAPYPNLITRGSGNSDDIEFYQQTSAFMTILHNRSGSNGGTETDEQIPVPPNNVWTNIVITYDVNRASGPNNRWQIYYNGVLQTPHSVGEANGEAPVAVNTRWQIAQSENSVFGPNPYYNGYLDDIRVYNRALTVQEVNELYNQGAGHLN